MQFFCCPAAAATGIAIDSIVEVSLCRYEMRVCMPTLCAEEPPPPPPGSELAKASLAASAPADTVDGLPRSFVLVYWLAVIAEKSQELLELAGNWAPAAGISAVRFGS